MNWKSLQSMSMEEIVDWAEPQPWAVAMSQCEQDREWHAEDDVWTHTKLVFSQLQQLDEWADLNHQERIVLAFTGLFHDAAKPLTTVVDSESGHVRSPKHAVKGEHLARSVLRDLECDLQTREQICGLVRYHGRPVFLQERDEPVHEIVRLSWLTDNRLLYLFALADYRGRDTDALGRTEEDLHYWKLLAEETTCYGNPFAFPNDHARFLFFRQPQPNLHYVPHEEFRSRVTMLSGLPGSGKDTWLASQRNDLEVVSLDELRDELDIDATENQGSLIQFARERCREYLRRGEPFVFNATNLLRQTRARWINLFADYGAHIELIYLEPPLKQILRQNHERQQAIPEQVIRKLASKVEPPNWLECHRLFRLTG